MPASTMAKYWKTNRPGTLILLSWQRAIETIEQQRGFCKIVLYQNYLQELKLPTEGRYHSAKEANWGRV
jgi:hypothetical protein